MQRLVCESRRALVSRQRVKQIKIIKRKNDRQVPTKRESKGEVHSPSASEMKKTVTSWIHEFHNKRRLESQRAFRDLFGQP